MAEFLVFQLYGPLAAWGEIAVGERRGSWSRPSKSAVVGFLAGALGIRRDESAALAALAAGYGMAVRIDAPGQFLRDYHTAQTVAEPDLKRLRKADARPLTRRRQMKVADRETILSQRDYYADALYVVALWRRDGAPYTLNQLAAVLRRPRFAPYLGRKSCPPALPLAPTVVAAADVTEALAQWRAPDLPTLGQPLMTLLDRRANERLLAWEDDAVPIGSPRVRPRQVERRRDQPLDRQRWQFTDREERVGTWVEVP